MAEEVRTYRFRDDFYELVDELRLKDQGQTKDRSIFLNITPSFQQALNALAAIMKEDKIKIYTLTKESKLLLDKALFKKNYTGRHRITLHSYPFDFWEIATHQELYDQLIMVDKKKNLIMQVGGIPALPLRSNIYFQLIHHNKPPPLATKEVEVGEDFRVMKMSDKDLEFMQPILEKVRSQVFGEGVS